jgi:hypothetical protein
MKCDCPTCNGKDYNPIGIQIAEKEVIPFFKQELLKVKYPTHPFPLKYDGLLASLLCFGQALAYNRAHAVHMGYYTENKWILKFGLELFDKFGMKVAHSSELKGEAKFVCEFNVGDDNGEVSTV